MFSPTLNGFTLMIGGDLRIPSSFLISTNNFNTLHPAPGGQNNFFMGKI